MFFFVPFLFSTCPAFYKNVKIKLRCIYSFCGPFEMNILTCREKLQNKKKSMRVELFPREHNFKTYTLWKNI